MLTKSRFLSLFMLTIFTLSIAVAQDELLPCSQRPHVVLLPRVHNVNWCIEKPIDMGSALAITAIAFDDEGILYATSPQRGELLAFDDADGDGLPDQPRVVASGLRLPNGLAYEGDTLYVVGDGIVYAFREGEMRIVADDLPSGRGFFASGIATHEGLLYIGIPAPCDACVPDDPLRGTVLRMTPVGESREIVARGLRYPAALEIHDGQLWITDSARDGLRGQPFLDELNIVDLAQDDVPHFGWPYCVGLENVPDMPGDFDCAQAAPPHIVFGTGSIPLALHSYTSERYSFLTGDLIFVLGGSLDNNPIRGYEVAFLDEQADGSYIVESILPSDLAITRTNRTPYDPAQGYDSGTAALLNRRGAGAWPQRIFGVAESPEGYVTISVGGGVVYVLRPGDYDTCSLREC